MAFRDDVVISWALSPRILEVTGTSVNISVQDIVDTCRVLESELDALDDEGIIDAAGKDDLGEDTLVGITVKLLSAKLKFADKVAPTVCTVGGGNIISVDESGETVGVIEPSANVTVMVAQSSSATISNVDTLIADMDIMKSIEMGRWKIEDNQMIFYKPDNINEVVRFDLFDAEGKPTMHSVFERVRVV